MKVAVRVLLGAQQLELLEENRVVRRYPVSTAANGAGEEQESGCTPRGRHRIRIKIGAGCPKNTVFVTRRPTGEIYTPELGRSEPERDWILTRILWLTGAEPGANRGGNCDTLKRFIYIHGTADENSLGKAVSHGCIRMNNNDLIEIFDVVSNGTPVEIVE